MSTIGPRRRWFYLGGYWKDVSGNQSTGPFLVHDLHCHQKQISPNLLQTKTDPGDLHFPPDAWFEYDPDVSFLLGDQYATLLQSGGLECDTKDGTAGPVKILDLAMFTNPPLPYSIWRSSKPVEVTNPLAPPSMFGKHLIGCFDAGFWSRVAKCMPGQPLPPSCGMSPLLFSFLLLLSTSSTILDTYSVI